MKENELKNVRWGDIYYCDLGVTNGSVQSGNRPVLVVQTKQGCFQAIMLETGYRIIKSSFDKWLDNE